MGRPTISKQVHIAQGTYRADRQGDSGIEMDTIDSLPAPPSLSSEAKAWWAKIVPPALKTGLLCSADGLVLEQAFLEWQTSQRYRTLASQAQGDIPLVVQLDKEATFHATAALKILYKYGVTPQENAKVHTGKKTDDTSDPIQTLIANGG